MLAEHFGDKPRVFSGVGIFPSHRPVLGRIVFEESTEHCGKEAVLYVCKRPPEIIETNTVGVILLGEAASPPALSVPVLAIPHLSEALAGTIALLDPDLGTLTVDPDLSALGDFSKQLKGERFSADHPVLPRFSSLSTPAPSDGFGFLLDPASVGDGDIKRLIENFAPRPITLIADHGNDLYEKTRNIYSESVYGRCSLMLRGILTAEDAHKSLRLCHRCICDLRAEGRECNGYLPRGLLIDTPLLLEEAEEVEGFDFFCLDYDLLCERLCGGNSQRLRRETERRIEHLAEQRKDLGQRLILRSCPDEQNGQFLRSVGFEELFLPLRAIPSAYALLSNMAKKSK